MFYSISCMLIWMRCMFFLIGILVSNAIIYLYFFFCFYLWGIHRFSLWIWQLCLDTFNYYFILFHFLLIFTSTPSYYFYKLFNYNNYPIFLSCAYQFVYLLAEVRWIFKLKADLAEFWKEGMKTSAAMKNRDMLKVRKKRNKVQVEGYGTNNTGV